MSEADLLTVSAAAHVLRITVREAREWVYAGRLRAVWHGDCLRIPRRELIEQRLRQAQDDLIEKQLREQERQLERERLDANAPASSRLASELPELVRRLEHLVDLADAGSWNALRPRLAVLRERLATIAEREQQLAIAAQLAAGRTRGQDEANPAADRAA